MANRPLNRIRPTNKAISIGCETTLPETARPIVYRCPASLVG